MDGINLKGLVISKYGSIAAFAKEMGWCNSKASRVIRGVQNPDSEEIKEMVTRLGITDPCLVISVFLS